MRATAYLDMDGVVVDFMTGALESCGKSLPFKDVRWDFMFQIGFTKDTLHEFWQRCDRRFWTGLPWMDDGRCILDAVLDLFGEDVCFVSSPCDTEGCADGKLDWVSREVPILRRKTFLGSAKYLLAAANKVLIDDHDDNVDRFVAHGGHAVLIPRPWNRRRDEIDGLGRFSIESFRRELRDARSHAHSR